MNQLSEKNDYASKPLVIQKMQETIDILCQAGALGGGVPTGGAPVTTAPATGVPPTGSQAANAFGRNRRETSPSHSHGSRGRRNRRRSARALNTGVLETEINGERVFVSLLHNIVGVKQILETIPKGEY